MPHSWKGILSLTKTKNLPVNIEFSLNEVDSTFTIHNGTEQLAFPIENGPDDSLKVQLQPYESELHFTYNHQEIKGWWFNLAKGPNYKIAFSAEPSTSLYDYSKLSMDLALKYSVKFGSKSSSFPAILLLKKDSTAVTGTFKTETGDYRFLWGEQTKDSIWLACFDGAHAFLFTASVKDGQFVNGTFYSGNHYTEHWRAKRNDKFQLKDPTELTKGISDSVFRFSLFTPKGTTFTEDSLSKGKVTLIQIMGTWCPNCKDETEFLKTLHNKYSPDEIEIIAASFEYQKDTSKALERIAKYKASMQIPYSMYYGGGTEKQKVTSVFPDLDRVISYPTLIILDKSGQVAQIHTGFNGPATDEYADFVEKTNQLIDSLIIH